MYTFKLSSSICLESLEIITAQKKQANLAFRFWFLSIISIKGIRAYWRVIYTRMGTGKIQGDSGAPFSTRM